MPVQFNPITGKFDLSAPSIPPSGWIVLPTTLSYSSVDGHIFVVTTNSIDLTGIIGTGDRIKFTNNSTTFFGIVVAISSTTITLYGGTQYAVANSSITNPFYSHVKNPFGFNTRADYWTDTVTNTSDVGQLSPTITTWYNLGSLSINIPIGIWLVSYSACIQSQKSSADFCAIQVTLSTANNSQSDSDFTSSNIGFGGIATTPAFVQKVLSLTSKTTYYLNAQALYASQDNVYIRGGLQPTFIKAVSIYL